MEMEYCLEEEFESLNMAQAAEYEACVFKACDWSNQDLSRKKIIDCEFLECNLSNAKLLASSFQNCHFRSSKLLGSRFDSCSDFSFGISARSCFLNHANFYEMDLRRSSFRDCDLSEADFSRANLSSISLRGSKLQGILVEGADLSQADLRECHQLEIDPEQVKIEGAQIDQNALAGLLGKYKLKIGKA